MGRRFPCMVIECESDEDVQALKRELQKHSPMKPIIHEGTNRADCPVCGKTVRGIDKPFGDYCSGCGQALDWS